MPAPTGSPCASVPSPLRAEASFANAGFRKACHSECSRTTGPWGLLLSWETPLVAAGELGEADLPTGLGSQCARELRPPSPCALANSAFSAGSKEPSCGKRKG